MPAHFALIFYLDFTFKIKRLSESKAAAPAGDIRTTQQQQHHQQ
jgi:hypothetical protein